MMGSAGTSAGRLSASFADITAMSNTIGAHVRTTGLEAGRVTRMMGNGDLLESLILSPGTGAAAEAALLAASGRLTVHIALTTGVGIVAATIVTTYELADATLQMAASSLSFVVGSVAAGAANLYDVTSAAVAGAATVITAGVSGAVTVIVEGARTVAAGATIVAVALTAAGMAISSLVAGFGAELVQSWGEAIGATLADMAENPWMLLIPFVSLPFALTSNTIDKFSVDDALGNTTQVMQSYLGAMGPGFDVMIGGLLAAGSVFGFADGGVLSSESTLSADERSDRGDIFDKAVGKALEGRTVPRDEHGNIIPVDLQSLMLSMAQIDALGKEDEAVIRVVRSAGDPPSFSLIIPSTQEWDPRGSLTPNDLMGNLNIMGGSSALQRMAEEALQQEIAAYMATHPGYSTSDFPVMVAGFSQGGITAGAFAESFSGKYNIQQVVTIGAPIGRFDIPEQVNVIAYESKLDPVVILDGRNNPAGWETIRGDNGGGFPGSHNAITYSQMAADIPPARPNNLDTFFDHGSTSTEYFGVKP